MMPKQLSRAAIVAVAGILFVSTIARVRKTKTASAKTCPTLPLESALLQA